MIEGKKLGLVGRVVLAAGAVGGLVFNSGCSDYGNALSRSVGEYALMEGVAGAVRNEVEGPRGTMVNVGGNVNKIYDPVKNGRIIISRWKDYNGNKGDDSGELLGDIGDSVNMSEMGIKINLSYYINPSESVLYILLNSNDEIVSKVNSPTHGILIPRYFLLEGNYNVVAQRGIRTTHSRKFNVTR